MTAQLRLILLVLVFAYSVAFGAGQGLGAAKKRVHGPHRLKIDRTRLKRRAVVAESAPFGARAVRYARRFLGTPYRYGGDSPSSGFDCSGLVRFVYAHFGLSLPHSTYADYDLGKRVSRGSLLPGDLVFFDGVGHVGMYIGNGRFIHAPHTGTDVQVTSLDEPWYRSSYDGARRLVSEHRHVSAPAKRVAQHVKAKTHEATARHRDSRLATLLYTARTRSPFRLQSDT